MVPMATECCDAVAVRQCMSTERFLVPNLPQVAQAPEWLCLRTGLARCHRLLFQSVAGSNFRQSRRLCCPAGCSSKCASRSGCPGQTALLATRGQCRQHGRWIRASGEGAGGAARIRVLCFTQAAPIPPELHTTLFLLHRPESSCAYSPSCTHGHGHGHVSGQVHSLSQLLPLAAPHLGRGGPMERVGA